MTRLSRVSMSTALILGLSLAAGCASSSPPVAAPTKVAAAPIDRAEVEAAQRAWCDGLIAISTESQRGGDARAVATRVLATAYAYDRGPVLFKPTMTHGAQTFRMDQRGALAYFVGGDAQYPDDHGFARKPWTACRAEVAGVHAAAGTTLAMGNVYLTRADGTQVKVDKTFGYVRGPDARPRIVLHHSSLPYTP